MKLRIIFIFCLLFQFSLPAHAIFGIKDVYKELKKIYELEGQYLPQLTNLGALQSAIINSTNIMQTLQRSLYGNYGYGNLLNNQTDLDNRLWSNDKWIDVLAKTNANNSAFMQAQEMYERLYPSREPSQVRTTLQEADLNRTYYQQTRNLNRAALATSSYSYDNINQHIRNLHDMIKKLEDHPEEKAAIDLNTRIAAELGFIQLEILKQQTIQTQLIATQSQQHVNGMSDESKFLEW